jgi:endonuclease YncB( thermonuclease family)
MYARLLILCLLCAAASAPAREWTVFESCTWIENPANDGDSFHIRHKKKDYLVRLYFVDAPETDNRYPDRIREQADYFSLTPDQALAGGKSAAAFTRDLLKDKTFQVYTQYVDARGGSDQKRYHAMVKVDGRWLSELLAEAGWVRLHGIGDELPDKVSERRYWTRLRTLEKEAKAKLAGLWAGGQAKAIATPASGKIRLPHAAPIFDRAAPHAARGNLPGGWEVELGPSSVPGFRDVRFVSPGGTPFEGMVRDVDLP